MADTRLLTVGQMDGRTSGQMVLGHGNLNFVLDTFSHYALPLCEILLYSFQPFFSYCEKIGL